MAFRPQGLIVSTIFVQTVHAWSILATTAFVDNQYAMLQNIFQCQKYFN